MICRQIGRFHTVRVLQASPWVQRPLEAKSLSHAVLFVFGDPRTSCWFCFVPPCRICVYRYSSSSVLSQPAHPRVPMGRGLRLPQSLKFSASSYCALAMTASRRSVELSAAGDHPTCDSFLTTVLASCVSPQRTALETSCSELHLG